MGRTLFAVALVLERSERQLDGDHLGGDTVDAVAVPDRRGIRGIELAAQVLVLAVQLFKLHESGSSSRNAVDAATSANPVPQALSRALDPIVPPRARCYGPR